MRTVCLFVLLCVSALSYGAKKYKFVEISTNLGNIKIRLYVLPIPGMLRKKRQ